MGSAGDLDTAKAEFKAAWEALKARTPPEDLAGGLQGHEHPRRRLGTCVVSGQFQGVAHDVTRHRSVPIGSIGTCTWCWRISAAERHGGRRTRTGPITGL
jgi:hypothetical protein